MEEIGRRLRAARVAKGITLEEVEEETRIRKKYIDALETGRTVLIPGEVYVKGFLRTYGNFLGLDGEALVEEYKSLKSRPEGEGEPEAKLAAAEPSRHTLPEEPARTPAAQTDNSPRPPAVVRPTRRAGSSGNRDRHGRRSNGGRARGHTPGIYILRRTFVALLVILPLAGAGYWLWNRPASAPEPPPTTAQPSPTQTEPEPEPEPSTAVEQEPEPTPEPPKPTVTMKGPEGTKVFFTVSESPVKVRMEHAGPVRERLWLDWFVDGKRVYNGLLEEPLEFEGKEIEINVGHLQGINLTINGQPYAHGLEGGPYLLHFVGE